MYNIVAITLQPMNNLKYQKHTSIYTIKHQ